MSVRKIKVEKVAEEIRNSTYAKELGWKISVNELLLFVQLPHRKNGQTYLLRLDFAGFPEHAPSYTFVDQESKEVSNDDKWPPKVNTHQKKICIPGTREMEIIHPNDNKYVPWNQKKYPILWTIREIDRLMHS